MVLLGRGIACGASQAVLQLLQVLNLRWPKRKKTGFFRGSTRRGSQIQDKTGTRHSTATGGQLSGTRLTAGSKRTTGGLSPAVGAEDGPTPGGLRDPAGRLDGFSCWSHRLPPCRSKNHLSTTLKDCNIFSGNTQQHDSPPWTLPPLCSHGWGRQHGLENLELWKSPCQSSGTQLAISEEPAQGWFWMSVESFLGKSLQTR